MRSRQSVFIVLLAACGLAALANNAFAAPLSVPDSANPLFGQNAYSSSFVTNGNGAEYLPPKAVDGLLGGAGASTSDTGDFAFGGGDPNQRLVIDGFDSSVGIIRIWTNAAVRPLQMTIRSSTNNVTNYNFTNGVATTSFETLLTSVTGMGGNAGWTPMVGNPDQLYQDFAVLTPAHTKSLYFDFGAGSSAGPPNNTNYGLVYVSEAQAHTNLLAGKGAYASSVNAPDYTVDKAVDGRLGLTGENPNTFGDFVFAGGDPKQRLVIHGINSTMKLIRVWSDNYCWPSQVTIRSSTTDVTDYDFASVVPNYLSNNFETELVASADVAAASNWTIAGPDAGHWYHDFYVNAPVGTESLYFDFGAGNSPDGPLGDIGWARISEVQAFATPEPSTIVLLAIGAISLLAYAWRKRK